MQPATFAVCAVAAASAAVLALPLAGTGLNLMTADRDLAFEKERQWVIQSGHYCGCWLNGVLANLDLIDQQAPRPDDPDPNRAPYSDTQLLISLLGVLIFPHERTPSALGNLLKGYRGLRNIVTIRYRRGKESTVELGGAGDRLETIDPADLSDLPRLLRNSIAHFNIMPMNKEGRFGGVRVWNKDNNGEITLVVDLDFDALRPLARHILKSLGKSRPGLPSR